MRPTRRGLAVLAIVGLSLAVSLEYGPRAMNAIVVPLVVASLAAVLTVARVDEPRVTRRPIESGVVGETRPVAVGIDVDRPVAATVVDAVGDDLSATGNAVETTLTGESHRYEVALERRGVHAVGPLEITVTDVLGLVKRRFSYDRTERLIVRPRPYDLRGPRGDLRSLLSATERDDRREFDHLREYRPGDSFRDVHWKATAKRSTDEPLVAEYVAERGRGPVGIAAEAAPGTEDEMARAAASVATYVLEAGRSVDLTVPEGADRPEGNDPRDALATAGAGTITPAERRRADVLIHAREDGTTLSAGGREIPLSRLRGGRSAEREGNPSGRKVPNVPGEGAE